jgi:hypothetical protein
LIALSRDGKDADHKTGPSPEGYGPQGGGPRSLRKVLRQGQNILEDFIHWLK